MHVVVYDLASLDLRWGAGRRSARLYGANGVLLSVLDVEAGVDGREVAFRVADDALERARVCHPRALERFSARPEDRRANRRVALYNPFTARIAVGALGRTQVFAGDGPQPIADEGVAGEVDEGVLTLEDGRVWRLSPPDLVELTRQVESHYA